MKKILITALAIAVATPAFAGGGYGYHEWDEPEYGCTAPGACRLPGPGANGYYGVNGRNGNGYVPRPSRRPPVYVEPFICTNPQYMPSAQRWICPPVAVRPQ